MAQRININGTIFKNTDDAIKFLNQIKAANSIVQDKVKEINAEYLGKISSYADKIAASNFPEGTSDEFKRRYTRCFRYYSSSLQEKIDKISCLSEMCEAATTLRGTKKEASIIKKHIKKLPEHCHIIAASAACGYLKKVVLPQTNKTAIAEFTERVRSVNIPCTDGTIPLKEQHKHWETILNILFEIHANNSMRDF